MSRPTTRTVLAALLPAAVALVVTGSPAEAAASRCGPAAPGDCLTSVQFGATTPFEVPLKVVTSIPTRVVVTATPRAGETGPVRTLTDSRAVRSRSLVLPDLEMDTGYTIAVRATDRAGRSRTETWGISTRQVRLTTTLHAIDVYTTGDSDHTSGELWAHVSMPGLQRRLFADRPTVWGETTPVGVSSTAYGVDAARVQVQVVDDDCAVLGCAALHDTPPFSAPLVQAGTFVHTATTWDYDLGGVSDTAFAASTHGEGTFSDTLLVDDPLWQGPDFRISYTVQISWV